MAVTSAQWADLLDPIVRKWWEQGFARRAPMVPSLFNVQTSSRAYEEVSGVGAIGIDAWENYAASGQISEADFNQGYKQTFTHKEYVLDLGIERKLIDDDQHNIVRTSVMRMGDSAALRRETHGASVFNNAFTDSAPYAGADAVGLCSTAHPYGPDKTGSTQSNEFTLSLTKPNVATIREAMQAFTDDNGNIVAVIPDTLLVPPALEDEALVIARSINDPTSDTNAINPQMGRFQVVPWHYLTDSNAWFMIDSTLMKMGGLEWYDRVPVGIGLKGGQDTTVKAYWRSYMRYSYGWSDWRWVAGSNPS